MDGSSATMRYAFVDESGTTDPFSGGRYLVIGMVVAAQPRGLEMAIKRARKQFGATLPSGEMKAGSASQRVADTILGALSRQALSIIGVAVDKEAILRPPPDNEDLYRTACIICLRFALQRWPQLSVALDRRYTSRRLRDALEESLRRGVADLPHEILIVRQEDSVKRRELQAAHQVAWALFQNRERGVGGYRALIAHQVVVEETVRRELW